MFLDIGSICSPGDQSTYSPVTSFITQLRSTAVEDVARGTLSSGHARALLSLGDERSILKARERVASKGMSVRETETLVRRMKEGGAVREEREVDHLLLDLEDDLTRSLGTRVKIVSRGAGGKIEIEYYSDQELERLTEILKS